MIKGRKVKVISRKEPDNKKLGEVVHAFKGEDGRWISIVEYLDGERYIAIEGIDTLKYVRSIKYLRKLEV